MLRTVSRVELGELRLVHLGRLIALESRRGCLGARDHGYLYRCLIPDLIRRRPQRGEDMRTSRIPGIGRPTSGEGRTLSFLQRKSTRSAKMVASRGGSWTKKGPKLPTYLLLGLVDGLPALTRFVHHQTYTTVDYFHLRNDRNEMQQRGGATYHSSLHRRLTRSCRRTQRTQRQCTRLWMIGIGGTAP